MAIGDPVQINKDLGMGFPGLKPIGGLLARDVRIDRPLNRQSPTLLYLILNDREQPFFHGEIIQGKGVMHGLRDPRWVGKATAFGRPGIFLNG